MTGSRSIRRIALGCLGFAAAALCGAASCNGPDPNRVQGYVEGEFVYVASPLGGAVKSLDVSRGAQVKPGDLLYTLDDAPEKALRDEAERRLVQARANLADARKGKRPSELESVEAQLKQAQTALALSEREFTRQEAAHRSGATSVDEFERSRSLRDQDRQRVAQLIADLKTARLGSRDDQIAAAEADVRAREAMLANAEWNLAQKRQSAPQAGVVFDLLYREGEWVAAGKPVVVMLPPANVKVRAFIPQTRVGAIQAGDAAQVIVDGVPDPFDGKVSFVSPQAEYTPPVIYSRESRSKLVFMIEIRFDPATAAKLHPGQPVDVQLGP